MVGVGGQGIIMASDILAEVLLTIGFDVKKSEVHGMAQRGGSVVSQVRFGKKVYSPLIKKGEVDILFSLEMLESLRYVDYLNNNSIIILNNYCLNPPSVSLGVSKYPDPDGIYKIFKDNFPHVTILEGLELASKAGNQKAVGTVFLGSLSWHLDIDENVWFDVMKKRLPGKVIDVNISAFEAGRREEEKKSVLKEDVS